MTALLEIRGLAKRFDIRLGAFGERHAVVRALDDFTADKIGRASCRERVFNPV
jgi:hypothetical protein